MSGRDHTPSPEFVTGFYPCRPDGRKADTMSTPEEAVDKAQASVDKSRRVLARQVALRADILGCRATLDAITTGGRHAPIDLAEAVAHWAVDNDMGEFVVHLIQQIEPTLGPEEAADKAQALREECERLRRRIRDMRDEAQRLAYQLTCATEPESGDYATSHEVEEMCSEFREIGTIDVKVLWSDRDQPAPGKISDMRRAAYLGAMR